MTCDSRCRQPTPAQAHCPTCHDTFGGVVGFDLHRRDGQCQDPHTVGLVLRGGIWRRSLSQASQDALRRPLPTT